MSLSAQIEQLEEELEGYKNGQFIKELEDQISELEDENSGLKSELRDFGDNEDMLQDYRDAITNLENLFDNMHDCADDIKAELRKL